MTAKDLKNALLQEAVQAKLVPQIASEGNAKDLLEEIKKEKAKLIKEGKLKKEKPLPEITEDEIPFDIPENWCWCRLGDMVYNHGQKTPDKEFSYIDIGSIDNEHQKLNKNENFIQPEKAPSRARKIVKTGDIIYSTVRPYLHNMCIIDKEFSKEPIASTGFAVMTCPSQISNKYLFYYLLSPIFDNYANDTENAKGVAYPAINDDRLYKGIVPIPPLFEQKRIVSAIEQFMPFIEEYGKKEAELTALNADIAKTLKNAILQEAVQGKLAPQIASEGNAKDLLEEIKKEKAKLIKEGKLKKEKPLPEITEDEITFDIPENWCWCRLGELSKLVTKGTTPRGGNVAYKNTGIGFLRAENVAGIQSLDLSNLKYIDKETNDNYLKRSILEENDILITIAGTLGRTAIVKKTDLPLNANQAVSIVRLIDPYQIDLKYLVFAINSPDLQKKLIGQTKVTAIPNLTLEIIENCEIPLPPIGEQKRIVETIEKLLPLCEKLGENID